MQLKTRYSDVPTQFLFLSSEKHNTPKTPLVVKQFHCKSEIVHPLQLSKYPGHLKLYKEHVVLHSDIEQLEVTPVRDFLWQMG